LKAAAMTHNFEPVLPGRSQVRQSGGKLSIIVPAPSNSHANIFMLIWLIGWTIGGYWAARSFAFGPTNPEPNSFSLSGGRLFLGVWLCGWLYGEIAVLYRLLWAFFGREYITLDPVALNHRWSVLGLGRTKNYALGEVKNLRTAAAPSNKLSYNRQSPAMDASCIAFDYGRGSVYMAKSIDSGEATNIVEQIFAFNRLLKPKEHRV
jgi:hypothetical protein